MSSEAAELSSLATALDELAGRLSSIAERVTGTERDTVATAIFEVERPLRGAQRRLEKLVEDLGG